MWLSKWGVNNIFFQFIYVTPFNITCLHIGGCLHVLCSSSILIFLYFWIIFNFKVVIIFGLIFILCVIINFEVVFILRFTINFRVIFGIIFIFGVIIILRSYEFLRLNIFWGTFLLRLSFYIVNLNCTEGQCTKIGWSSEVYWCCKMKSTYVATTKRDILMLLLLYISLLENV